MFEHGKKYFPIKTETACLKKWTWSSVYLKTGTTNSCHRCNEQPFDITDFGSFHNVPKKLDDRKLMLAGQWPVGGCEYCQNIENADGFSDRMYHLEIPNLTPPELFDDPTAVSVTPQIVEIYLNNTCNLACTYCDSAFSSRIQHEIKRFGPFESQGIKIVDEHKYVDQELAFKNFCVWLEKNIHNIKRLHFAGGETFFQRELDAVLDIIDQNPNKNLELNFISNLMATKTQEYIERIKQMILDKKIGRLDITASLDCWGEAAEYIRHGLNLSVWERNFSYIVNQKWIKITVNSVITAMSVRTTADLIERLNGFREIRDINHNFLVVGKNPHLHPRIFGGDMWIKDFERMLSVFPSGYGAHDNEREYLNGIFQYLQTCKEDSIMIKRMHVYLDELDRRRNTNWKSLFPYLDI